MAASAIEVRSGLGISGLVGVGRLSIGNLMLFENADVERGQETFDAVTITAAGIA